MPKIPLKTEQFRVKEKEIYKIYDRVNEEGWANRVWAYIDLFIHIFQIIFHFLTVIKYNEDSDLAVVSSFSYLGQITEPKYSADISGALKSIISIISLGATFYYGGMMLIYEYELFKGFRFKMQENIFATFASSYNLFFMFTFLNFCFANFWCFDYLKEADRICNGGSSNWYIMIGVYSVALC